jgi:hypothetical protein
LMVTTHSPFFVNGLRPEELWVLYRDEKGFHRDRSEIGPPLGRGSLRSRGPSGRSAYSQPVILRFGILRFREQRQCTLSSCLKKTRPWRHYAT